MPRSYGQIPSEVAINWIQRIGCCDIIEDLEEEGYTTSEIDKIKYHFWMIINLGLKSYKEGNRIIGDQIISLKD